MRERLEKWAREAAKDPWRAPWSGQRVSIVARIGAWFLTLCFLFATIYVTSPYIAGSKPLDLSIQDIANAVLFAYALALFSRVALTGRAPKGWVPWH
jgi:hypothetical protein